MKSIQSYLAAVTVLGLFRISGGGPSKSWKATGTFSWTGFEVFVSPNWKSTLIPSNPERERGLRLNSILVGKFSISNSGLWKPDPTNDFCFKFGGFL